MEARIHERIEECIQVMMTDVLIGLPYYAYFLRHVNFYEAKKLGDSNSCGVNVTSKGMNFYWCRKFVDELTKKGLNFVIIHEIFHLLFNHPKRTLAGNYNHELANYAQDMIINHLIYKDIDHSFVEIPKDRHGRNSGVFIPVEYDGPLIFEDLYLWLKAEKDKRKDRWKKLDDEYVKKIMSGLVEEQSKKDIENSTIDESKNNNSTSNDKLNGDNTSNNNDESNEENTSNSNDGLNDNSSSNSNDAVSNNKAKLNGGNTPKSVNGDGVTDKEYDLDALDSEGKPVYGQYGKYPSNHESDKLLDTWSLDSVLRSTENGKVLLSDVHFDDDVPPEVRDNIIRGVMDYLRARGYEKGDIVGTINGLRKKSKDYLHYIKRSLSVDIFGSKKQRTITKLNRRGIDGLKGNRKIKTHINVIWDTSGSMNGHAEKVLEYVYRNDISMNIIATDVGVRSVNKLKSGYKLKSMLITGGGGTELNPAIQYVVEHFNNYNTVILTDGYHDDLELAQLKGNVLLISIGVECPIKSTNGKVKQIMVEKTV